MLKTEAAPPGETLHDLMSRLDQGELLLGTIEALNFLAFAVVGAGLLKPSNVIESMEALLGQQGKLPSVAEIEARQFAAGWVRMGMLGMENQAASKQ